jgi:serine/threonine protein kinase
MDIRVANKYRLVKKLGHGAFGDIYQGVNLKSGEMVAIKLVILRHHLYLILKESS